MEEQQQKCDLFSSPKEFLDRQKKSPRPIFAGGLLRKNNCRHVSSGPQIGMQTPYSKKNQFHSSSSPSAEVAIAVDAYFYCDRACHIKLGRRGSAPCALKRERLSFGRGRQELDSDDHFCGGRGGGRATSSG